MAARIGHLCVHWMSHGLYESGVGGRSPTFTVVVIINYVADWLYKTLQPITCEEEQKRCSL